MKIPSNPDDWSKIAAEEGDMVPVHWQIGGRLDELLTKKNFPDVEDI